MVARLRMAKCKDVTADRRRIGKCYTFDYQRVMRFLDPAARCGEVTDGRPRCRAPDMRAWRDGGCGGTEVAGRDGGEWYCGGMRTTIDKAGRIVIPAALRERAGLAGGAEIEITEEDGTLRLVRVAKGPRLVRVGRRLVARPTVSPDARPIVDVSAVVEDERNRWP